MNNKIIIFVVGLIISMINFNTRAFANIEKSTFASSKSEARNCDTIGDRCFAK